MNTQPAAVRTVDAGVPLRRRIRNLWRHLVAIIAAVVAITSLLPTPAEASPTGICTGREASGNHTVWKYVPASGWGVTNYRVGASVWASDLCNRGAMNVLVTIPSNVVTQRGGQIAVYAWARYYNRQSGVAGNWIALKLRNTWPSYEFAPPNGTDIQMNNQTLAVQVAVSSTIYLRQDGSGWVPMGTTYTYCDLWFTSKTSPGTCHG